MSKLKFRLFISALVIAAATSLGAWSSDAGACIDVIAPAVNPATGECREFPTPCQVPRGWIRVAACNAT